MPNKRSTPLQLLILGIAMLAPVCLAFAALVMTQPQPEARLPGTPVLWEDVSSAD